MTSDLIARALEIAIEELEFDQEHAIVERTGERRRVDVALKLVKDALRAREIQEDQT